MDNWMAPTLVKFAPPPPPTVKLEKGTNVLAPSEPSFVSGMEIVAHDQSPASL